MFGKWSQTNPKEIKEGAGTNELIYELRNLLYSLLDGGSVWWGDGSILVLHGGSKKAEGGEAELKVKINLHSILDGPLC